MTLISKRIATLRMSEEMTIFIHDLLNNAVESGIEQDLADFTEEAIEIQREFTEQMEAQGIEFEESVAHPDTGVLTVFTTVEPGLTLPSGLTYMLDGVPIGEIVGYDSETGRLTIDIYKPDIVEAFREQLPPHFTIAGE